MVQHLIERLRSRRQAKIDGEHGSLLLDVLIGMAIFALIALIAVSAISGYRQRAYETGAVSDAQGLALEIEADVTDTNPPAYPAYNATFSATGGTYAATWYVNGVTQTSQTYDQKASAGDFVTAYGLGTDASGQPTFCLVVGHTPDGTAHTDAWAEYDSSQGAITQKGRGSAAPTSCTP